MENIFNEWATGEYGIADDLRCCAMAAQEDGLPREDYMAAAEARGYNKATAARCWAFVLKQW